MKNILPSEILKNFPSGILIFNLNGEIIFSNKTFNLLFRIDTLTADLLPNLEWYDINLNSHNFLEFINCFSNSTEAKVTKNIKLKDENLNYTDAFIVMKLLSTMEYPEKLIILSITEIANSEVSKIKANNINNSNIDKLVDIIGHHESMKELFKLIHLAADSFATVLITGESGTGKERVADAIHLLSDRKSKPFIKVNCSALSESLLESELFGHVRGSFTGAIKDKIGKFEAAHGGTIFLDEIGEISPLIQLKILRIIQEKTFEKVGDNKSNKVDVRIITATNKNLRELVSEGKFREDLFYRLNVFPLMIVPLRERKIDIPFLCEYFIDKFNAQTKKKIKGFTESAYRILMDYCWPGNIRELENAIEHAFVLCNTGLIDIFDLPQDIRLVNLREGLCKGINTTNKPTYFYKNHIEEIKSEVKKIKRNDEELKSVIISALNQCKWNKNEAAQLLGISRVALWKKMKKLNME